VNDALTIRDLTGGAQWVFWFVSAGRTSLCVKALSITGGIQTAQGMIAAMQELTLTYAKTLSQNSCSLKIVSSWH
jgi:hypothetical protein